ncbi:lipoprotein N-acyltransferase Lnb domain-containing protein [Pseudomonas sp. LRF_L74]|uniref:Lnb N-terminal periplasmic domain-containing protein n=1 Tax=Pseudomonas sp. LRF_L74 TaxID=3369422 RepID=UPI003F614B0E
MSTVQKLLRYAVLCLLTLTGFLLSAWGALALGYHLQWPAAMVYGLIGIWCLFGCVLLVLLWRRRAGLALLGYLVSFGLLAVWWGSLEPSNQRVWADDVAKMASGRVAGSRLTLDNVRNFDWRSDQDYQVAWETRDYDLDRLASVDLVTSYWGMPAIAHILVSFGFEDGRFLTFSVEVRKEKGEAYSEIGGFFKQFELSIVATDERDALRVRTNVRGEEAYLYRLDLPRSAMRALLLAYVEQANALIERPRFYNTVTANCTTIVFDMMQSIVGGLPMDYRLLLTGYLPGYAMDNGGLQPGYPLDELRRLGHFTARARASGQALDFSWRIRRGVPGW